MKKTSLQEVEYLIAWVIFFLCATVGSAIVGFIGGGIVGAVLGAAGAKIQSIRAVVGFVLSLPVSYIVFRFVVGKFIVEKVEERARQSAPPVPAYTGAPAPPTPGLKAA